jgi:triosephosphate isomerase
MPTQYVIANWKMNLPPEGIAAYMAAMARSTHPSRLVVAPPFPYLTEVARAAGRVGVGAQNCCDRDKGAFTGEVSPLMIRDCGAQYVIVGHSERRTLYGETDAMIGRKLTLAIATALTPILCIGEDLRARDAGKVAIVLADQIRAVASAALDTREVIIAYEPVWAIGTGRNATGDMVAETLESIRDALRRFWPPRYVEEAPILYGGSVTPDNVGDLVAHGRIDGFLVGGASLDSARFLAIQSALTAP